jgi:hypothetical protein
LGEVSTEKINLIMKNNIIFLILISTVSAAQADLVIIQEQTAITQNKTSQSYTVTNKIHGDKIRTDTDGGLHADTSMILDANTCASFILFHKDKSVIKDSGVKEKELQEKEKQSGNTNSVEGKLAKPLDTGKSEKVGAYDTEIYTWSGVNGSTATFWVAKDFPNYEKIKVAIDKLGPYAGLARLNVMITLPGIVVKSQMILKSDAGALTSTATLISVKEEPIDASTFEVPNDYADITPPVRRQHTNTVTTPNK